MDSLNTYISYTNYKKKKVECKTTPPKKQISSI